MVTLGYRDSWHYGGTADKSWEGVCIPRETMVRDARAETEKKAIRELQNISLFPNGLSE